MCACVLTRPASQHILRDGQELDVVVPTVLSSVHTTDRIVQYVRGHCRRRAPTSWA